MNHATLLDKIESKDAHIVVIGLGYVGLPVACLFADAGFSVIGLDVDEQKVDTINQGICPIEGKEPGLPQLVSRVVTEGALRATTDYAACSAAQIVLIAVETPVDPDTHKPHYHALRAALTDLAHHLQPDTLVIIESTLAPGTMDGLVKPLLERESGLKAAVPANLQPSTSNLQPPTVVFAG